MAKKGNRNAPTESDDHVPAKDDGTVSTTNTLEPTERINQVTTPEQIVDDPPPDPATRYPICLAGKRACPPEDCGGVWGYAEFLDAIASPDHPEHESMLDWVGGRFDPEDFDLQEVNSTLATVR